MRKVILLSGLFYFLFVFFGQVALALDIYSGNFNSPIGRNFNRFSRLRNGTLTGFSPPVYTSTTYYPSSGVSRTVVNRFFNPNYNNHYINSPYYNPYANGNYVNMPRGGFRNFFSLPNTNWGYQNPSNLNSDLMNNSSAGVNVTILD